MNSMGNYLTLASAGVGAISALYWYLASRISFSPNWSSERPEPATWELKLISATTAIMSGARRSGAVNGVAAALTALSMALNALSTLVSQLASN